MPQGKHSTIQRDLIQALDITLKKQQIGRAFPKLCCTFAGRSIVPDIAVFTNAHIPRDENGCIANQFLLPPDWVIEILSPDQSQTKVTKKILYCLEQGTRMGWLIDPDEQTVFVYNPGLILQAFDLETSAQKLPVPDFARSVSLSVADIMNWLLE